MANCFMLMDLERQIFMPLIEIRPGEYGPAMDANAITSLTFVDGAFARLTPEQIMTFCLHFRNLEFFCIETGRVYVNKFFSDFLLEDFSEFFSLLRANTEHDQPIRIPKNTQLLPSLPINAARLAAVLSYLQSLPEPGAGEPVPATHFLKACLQAGKVSILESVALGRMAGPTEEFIAVVSHFESLQGPYVREPVPQVEWEIVERAQEEAQEEAQEPNCTTRLWAAFFKAADTLRLFAADEHEQNPNLGQ